MSQSRTSMHNRFIFFFHRLSSFFTSFSMGITSLKKTKSISSNEIRRERKKKKLSWWIQWSRWWFDLFATSSFILNIFFFLFRLALWMLSSLLYFSGCAQCVRHKIQYTESIWSKRWRICINILSNMIYDACPATFQLSSLSFFFFFSIRIVYSNISRCRKYTIH